MIDIHMHILPNIDDGSKNIKESIEEIKMSVSQGVKVIFATPHSWAIDGEYVKMRNQYNRLIKEIKKKNILIDIYQGCEILCYPFNINQTILNIKNGTYPTMGNTNYILIEFDLYSIIEDMIYCVDRLKNEKYIPILAHAERYRSIEIKDLYELKRHGALVQINAYSIINEKNCNTKKFANELLQQKLVDFIGSDAHRLSHRPPIIKDGVCALTKKYPKKYVNQILNKNPSQLLIKEEMKMKQRYWLNGIMGVIIGDALGCPVEFYSRGELKNSPVYEMEGYGTFNLPKGSWTDDSSMTLALLDSIKEKNRIDLQDIMYKFAEWIENGKYTPFEKAFDVGCGTMASIIRWLQNRDVTTCGGTTGRDNGNGALMRILPACLYVYEQKMGDMEAIQTIHKISGLTHNHLRSKIACGLYYFCVQAILNGNGDLNNCLQNGMKHGFEYYKKDISNIVELSYYGRLKDLSVFKNISENEVKSSGYVVDSLEAAIWSLITTNNFKDCELKAVNLGGDTDTIAAIAGGLAGLYYGYDNIPKEWIEVIQKREWIENMLK